MAKSTVAVIASTGAVPAAAKSDRIQCATTTSANERGHHVVLPGVDLRSVHLGIVERDVPHIGYPRPEPVDEVGDADGGSRGVTLQRRDKLGDSRKPQGSLYDVAARGGRFRSQAPSGLLASSA